MKIGILTFHTPCNFGANLQAYSSCQYLRRLGNDVFILNFVRETDSTYKGTISKEQWQAHQNFVKSHLPITKELRCLNDVKDEIKRLDLDMILIGADAVWRAPKTENDMIFYGTWILDKEFEDMKVSSLSAAHMGDGYNDVSSGYKDEIKRCLSKFKVISVRDSWTRDKLNEDIFCEQKVEIVSPDPVVWLSEYMKKYTINFPDGIYKGKYIVMSLPQNWVKRHTRKRFKWFLSFKAIINNKGYKLVELPLPEGVSGAKFDYTVPYPINPQDWFVWLRDAKAFCGLRFHSIVSCISAGTPFYSIDSYGNSSLIVAGLNRLGLYRLGRSFDNCSKIKNLLGDSLLKNLRINSDVTNISPIKLFNILDKTDPKIIVDYRDRLRLQFDSTLNEIFEK